jgi:GNAT superfamily N-acetyltransferase
VAGSGRARAEVRAATERDLQAIAAIAVATGQEEDWEHVFPGYLKHLMTRGRLVVAERDGEVIGYGGSARIGTAEAAACMLTDLFVDPAAQGTGIGRALLAELWAGQPRRMTFSSLHSHAFPLYASFGVDAWWPLLYLRGNVRRLAIPTSWTVAAAGPAGVAALELAWTGIDRSADHELWARWPMSSGVIASLSGQPVAAGTVGGAPAEYGISHLVMDAGSVSDEDAADAVTAVLAWLDPPDGQAHVRLPAPHPATRPLLAAGWRVDEFDLYMASEPGLLNPRRLVPSPALA